MIDRLITAVVTVVLLGPTSDVQGLELMAEKIQYCYGCDSRPQYEYQPRQSYTTPRYDFQYHERYSPSQGYYGGWRYGDGYNTRPPGIGYGGNYRYGYGTGYGYR